VFPVDAMTGMIHAGFMCSPNWLIFYLGLITALGKHQNMLCLTTTHLQSIQAYKLLTCFERLYAQQHIT